MASKNKIKKLRTYYLFLDVETTGLNYNQQGDKIENHLLEAAWIFTDKNMNVLTKGNVVIGHKKDFLNEVISKEALSIHRENGLIRECVNSKVTVSELDNLLSSVINDCTDGNARIILAGSSVHFDKEAVRRHLPEVYAMLHYRVLDVSSVRSAFSIVSPKFAENQEKKKQYTHRATDDIHETFREFKTYLNAIDRRGR